MTSPPAPRAGAPVGRGPELAVLDGILGRARDGQGGAVFLVGEPGIGKTRLALEAAGRAGELGLKVLRGRGSPIGPVVPFRPLREALLALSRSGDLPPDDSLGPYRAVLGRLVPDWAHLVLPQTDTSLVVLAEAVLRLTSVVGRGTGCLLMLDDLQDADAETLAVAEYLADNLDGQPTVLITTVRGEASDALAMVQGLARRGTGTVLELGRLDRDSVAAMVAARLGVSVPEVPASLLDQLWDSSAGVPFVVEELTDSMLANGWLVRQGGGWAVLGTPPTEVPASLLRQVTLRTDRLGEQGRQLLSAAALLGRRFPLAVVQQVSGLDDRSLLSQLRAAAAAQLVGPDDTPSAMDGGRGQAVDWYSFRHPLIAEGLLGELMPAERAELSGRVAAAVERSYPGLPGEWCQLTGTLRLAAGDRRRAGELFAEAGRRALTGGAATSAVMLLDRAQGLLDRPEDSDLRADALETLIPALAEAGRVDQALALAGEIESLGGTGLSRRRRAALRTRLARVAGVAGRWQDGWSELAAARSLLEGGGGPEDTAALDAVGALLALGSPGPHRAAEAEELARRALVVAERVPLPDIAFEACQALGLVARARDSAESDDFFARARELAEEHQLPASRVYALARLGVNSWLAEGATADLIAARDESRRLGMVVMDHSMQATLTLDAVLCGRYADATTAARTALAEVARLRLTAIRRHLLASLAVAAGHRAARAELADVQAEFEDLDGAKSSEQTLVLGLGRAFCALLEEDHPTARAELAESAQSATANPNLYQLAGAHGLAPLLAVLDGGLSAAGFAPLAAAAAGRMRWNRQFVRLATAVLAGRDGDLAGARAAHAQWQADAAAYPLARHLGVRLVAEEAHRAGWADPVDPLRAAEAFLHDLGAPAAASACRGLLRSLGASVQQRRTGADRVPQALRAAGVTVREFEVLEVLGDPRLTNKAIGERLHISPRTVEKHVAALIVKTGRADRAALAADAESLRHPD